MYPSHTFSKLWVRRIRNRYNEKVNGYFLCDVLTTVSLRQLLALPAKDGAQDILVLENKGGCFGLLVDSVGEVLTVSASEYEPNPSILNGHRRDLLAGAYKLKDHLLIMLDPERLDPVRLELAASNAGRAA